MATTSATSGTLASTGSSTEDTVASINVAGVYQFWVDMTNMAAGDIVILKLYRVVKTGGTTHLVHQAGFYGVQPVDKVARTDGVANPLTDTAALKLTLTQTAGSSRNFDYGVDKVA